MYALPNKTQHKLIVKVRGGISQKLDNLTSSPQAESNNKFATGDSRASSTLRTVPSIKESPFAKQIDEAGFNAELSHLPQPIFHSVSDKNGAKTKSATLYQRSQKKYITPEHNEMIKYVQQSWKGVEQDYKKSVNKFISKIDLNSPSQDGAHLKVKQANARNKTATASTPLLLSGSYHHTSITKDSGSNRQDNFQPFDLEAFWGNRILKRLTQDI